MRFIIIAIISLFIFARDIYAEGQIRIVGSSTVYPFSASVAEHLGKIGDYRTPIVEATGSGAGIKLFCDGVGKNFPDVANSSRVMLPIEKEQCIKHSVNKFIEIKFGYDGITLANSLKGELFNLSRKQIFLALAREIIKDGKIVKNDYKRWSDIDKSLPDVPIKIYGTPPVSGTYDTFIDLVMKKGCMQVPEFAAIKDEKERDRKCKGLREDGVFVEAGENGNLIAQKLIGDSNSLGIIGFNFLDQNMQKLQGSIIDGQAPSFDAIQNGVYPISRPLFFYIKGENLSQKAAIKEYVREFLSEAAIGDEGYLINQGLIPLLEEERKQIRKNIFQEIGE